jgi:hypothetical protein
MRDSFRIAEAVFREHSGILRSSQARSLGINPLTLSDMMKAGLLVRESRGLYRLADSYSSFLIEIPICDGFSHKT